MNTDFSDFSRETALKRWNEIYSRYNVEDYLKFEPYENTTYKIKGLIVSPRYDCDYIYKRQSWAEARAIRRNKAIKLWEKMEITKDVPCDNNWYWCDEQAHPLVPSKLVIPAEVNGVPVVACKMFNNLWELEEVVLPETMRVIVSGCFSDAMFLKKVVNLDKVTFIGSESFSECENLSVDWDTDISKELRWIGDLCFDNCPGFTGWSPLKFPDTLIELPHDSLDSVRREFSGTMVFPPKIKTIVNLFWRSCHACPGFDSVVFPKNVKTLGHGCFRDWTNLETIVIPKSVTVIGDQAFAHCKNLKTVIFEDGSKIKRIGKNAFVLCEKLENIIWGEGGAEKLERISDNAFCYCKNLKHIELPKNLKKLGEEVFDGTGLESVTIPKNVEFIPYRTFKNCKNLKTVEFEAGSEVFFGKEVFEGCENLSELRGFSGILKVSDLPKNFAARYSGQFVKMLTSNGSVSNVIMFSEKNA